MEPETHTDDDAPRWSRREILKILAAGAIGVPIAGCVTRAQTWTDARRRAPSLVDLPVGTAVLLRNERAILWRDGQGIAAIKAICPHRGCAVRIAAGQLVCPCHGSRFSRSGRLLRGPAREGLPWLRVSIDDQGEIEVHRGQVVAPGTYLSVM